MVCRADTDSIGDIRSAVVSRPDKAFFYKLEWAYWDRDNLCCLHYIATIFFFHSEAEIQTLKKYIFCLSYSTF